MKIDLSKKPFFLEKDDIKWVEETIHSMTIEEKIGQLFIHMSKSRDEDYIKNICEKYHFGGIRFFGAPAEEIARQNRFYQKYSKTPMFVACNLENGADSTCSEGTFVATHAQCGASPTDEAAYEMGRIAAKEASALGCNWDFAPITDIVYNWRNTIVNPRSFGNNPNLVLERSRAYIRGVHESNMLTCAKHFPGDGVEERDQHLVMAVNDMKCNEWDESFGMVYKQLIEDGLETVMVGHIALPEYSKKLKGDISYEEILPATLSEELVNGLLRKQLGFNGLVVTDASHMAGLLGAMPRKDILPKAIAAGCDMFLFLHNLDEDFGFMMDGYKNGIISDERLEEALFRILGMKARLGLHKKEQTFSTENIGCKEHHEIAGKIADQTITLVKDTQNLLPLNINEKKRARLYYIESAPVSYSKGTDPVKNIVKEELEKAGFSVDLNESLYDMEAKETSPMNLVKAMQCLTFEEFRNSYDIVFVFVHMKGYAQENNVRVKFSSGHSNEIPWWIKEVPTVCVSLNFTNHLYDLPMMKTFINAYSPTRESIKSTIDKILGKSPFEGIPNENVWCDRWDTRI